MRWWAALALPLVLNAGGKSLAGQECRARPGAPKLDHVIVEDGAFPRPLSAGLRVPNARGSMLVLPSFSLTYP